MMGRWRTACMWLAMSLFQRVQRMQESAESAESAERSRSFILSCFCHRYSYLRGKFKRNFIFSGGQEGRLCTRATGSLIIIIRVALSFMDWIGNYNDNMVYVEYRVCTVGIRNVEYIHTEFIYTSYCTF